MPLEKSCAEYLGCCLLVSPDNGWHILRTAEQQFDECLEEEPGPFHIRTEKFVYEHKQIAGGQGFIDEPGHQYHGFRVLFLTWADDAFLNFTTDVGDYKLIISPDKPRYTWRPGFRAIQRECASGCGFPQLAGLAEIQLSVRRNMPNG